MTAGASRVRRVVLALVTVGLVAFGMTLGGRDRPNSEAARTRPVPATAAPTTTTATVPARSVPAPTSSRGCSETALRAGDIVLLHFRPDLLASLQVAVDVARAAGLEPARLEE